MLSIRTFLCFAAGLLGSQGEPWHETRTRVQQDMMRPQSAMFYIDPLQDIANDLVSAIKDSRDASSCGTVKPTVTLLQLFAFEAISYVFLGERFQALDGESNPEAKEMVHNVTVAIDNAAQLIFALPAWIYMPYALKPRLIK